jgi:hypothetical protein
MKSAALLAFMLPLAALAQPVAPPADKTSADKSTAAERPANSKTESSKAARPSLESTLQRASRVILALQEGGETAGEWPYEGVYRVEGKIPYGYRIGGTGICSIALMRMPGFDTDEAAKAAVQRAIAFVVKGPAEPLMSFTDYDAGYDVRGWGYTYGLLFLLDAKGRGLIADEQKEAAEKAIHFYLEGIQQTEIPQVGGWNYARPPGKQNVAPPSPFMTAPTLQALFEARKAGYAVDDAVVARGLDTLDAAREPSGAIVYSGKAEKRKDGVPGAVGRMLASESVLYLAGRSSQANIRGALDAFIVHWDWLEKRRAQQGTHMGPYQIAPYYFYYAHYYAALAIELLPEQERAEYRRRIADLVYTTRADDGSWNDRVFPRSAAYSTAMCSLSLMMPSAPKPAGWTKE